MTTLIFSKYPVWVCICICMYLCVCMFECEEMGILNLTLEAMMSRTFTEEIHLACGMTTAIHLSSLTLTVLVRMSSPPGSPLGYSSLHIQSILIYSHQSNGCVLMKCSLLVCLASVWQCICRRQG